VTLSSALRSALAHYVTPNPSIALHPGVSFADGQPGKRKLSLVTMPESVSLQRGSARAALGRSGEESALRSQSDPIQARGFSSSFFLLGRLTIRLAAASDPGRCSRCPRA
jgi:hypothetical protein